MPIFSACSVAQLLTAVVLVVYPTGPFAICEPRDLQIGEFYEVQLRRTTYFEAPKL